MSMKETAEYDRAQQAADRRVLIKNIIMERGHKGVTELQRILEQEYDVKITRRTLYKDLDNLGNVTDDDYEKFSTTIIAGFRSHLHDLNRLSRDSDDPKIQISAKRAYFQGAKELFDIVNKMNIRDKMMPNSMDGKPQGTADMGKFNIRFNDTVEVVDDGKDKEQS